MIKENSVNSKSSKLAKILYLYSLNSFVLVGLLLEWSLLVAKGAQIDQTPALPTKSNSNYNFSFLYFLLSFAHFIVYVFHFGLIQDPPGQMLNTLCNNPVNQNIVPNPFGFHMQMFDMANLVSFLT